MKKLNIFFITIMFIGLILVSTAIQTKHSLLFALTGFSIICLSSVGYALNGEK